MAVKITSRGSLALLVLLLAVSLVFVLGREARDGGGPSSQFKGVLAEQGSYDGPESYFKGGAIDLIAYFPLAEVHGPLSGIEFQDAEEGRYLPMGWQRFSTDSLNADGAWINSRNGVVEVPLFERGSLELEMTLQTHPESAALSRQRVGVNWNGQAVENFSLEWGEDVYTVSIPETLQEIGINVLEIMPEYRFLPEPENNERALEAQGVRCSALHFRGAGVSSSGFGDARAVEGVVRQPAGTQIAYYFPAHRPLRLSAVGRLVSAENASVAGRVQVIARTRAGKEVRLYDRALDDLRADRPFEIDESLPSDEDEFVGLTFVVRGEEASGDLRIEWTEAKLEPIDETQEARARFPGNEVRNVFVILYDSLRADHTAPYGSNVRTPEMARIAKEGVTFSNAFTTSNWTRPSIASLLTSMHPTAHGILSGPNVLPVNVPYLPAILQDRGYRTLAVANNPHMSADFGFERGFDSIHKFYERRKEVRETYLTPEDQARHVWDEYIEPFLKAERDAPFFVYLHEIDPHYPYRAPGPYDRMYGDPTRSSLRIKLPLTYMVIDRSLVLEPEDAAYLDANYKGEISFMDAYLGWMLDKIRSTGHRDDTLVLFVSDHGDEFLDHGMIAHGHTLYDELLRIPMIFSLPGTLPQGRALRANAELVDVAPTILEHLGVEVPAAMRGKDLFAALSEGDEFQHDMPAFASMLGRDSVRFHDWKLIVQHPLDGHAGQSRYQLFETREDRGEHINAYPVEPIVAKALLQMLRWRLDHDAGFERELPFEETAEYTAEQEEHLRALGYVN